MFDNYGKIYFRERISMGTKIHRRKSAEEIRGNNTVSMNFSQKTKSYVLYNGNP